MTGAPTTLSATAREQRADALADQAVRAGEPPLEARITMTTGANAANTTSVSCHE